MIKQKNNKNILSIKYIIISFFLALNFHCLADDKIENILNNNSNIEKEINKEQKSIFSSNIIIKEKEFKIYETNKKIKDIVISDNKKIDVVLLDNDKKFLREIKVFGKESGSAKIMITLENNTKVEMFVNIVKDLEKIKNVISAINKEIIIEQVAEKVILQGNCLNKKESDKVLELLSKMGVDVEKDVVNVMSINNPSKMVRIKLYVTEINNQKGLEIKNNWAIGYKNYVRNDYNEQTSNSKSYIPALATAMENSVTLSGGLSAGANYLGSRFNTGVTLNYLSSEGVAKILDETELVTLENKVSTFHAGGNIYVKTQTTTAQGLPSTELKQIDYGIKLETKVNNIVNDEYVDLTITTKQDKIDWTNSVDGIPSFSTQKIDTNVVIKNGSTIVLGGLISQSDSKNYTKIPFLGDIPILGALFRSKDFQNGKSELVFFVVPEIVDPSIVSNVEEPKDFFKEKKIEEK
jgi:pilus assembly protein CpaC